ncbi:MAG TPA: nitronate monooxygenase [Acidimicrobiia bacterium]|nr:nitronate monooxygenase [Acidimicrobiia bacterium]
MKRRADFALWSRPVCVAPMGGGPTTPDLVAATADAGAFPFVGGAYLSAADLEVSIRSLAVRLQRPFGVNVFVPGRPTRDPAALDRYLAELGAEAASVGAELGHPRWDDDDWFAKIDVLVDAAPAVTSFTFGIPPRAAIDRLRRRGSLVMVTVTNVTEADAAVSAGADLLCAQGIEAGAHRATFDDTASDDELPTLELVTALRAHDRVPVVAAGGIATPTEVAAALAAGAVAVQVGTAFLRCDEAGTSTVHREALADPRFDTTALTRAFTGRRARGLVNGFMRRHPAAPSAFPEIHHATRPVRAAAARAGDADRVHLWAGTGYRHARSAPAAAIVDWLVSELFA